MDFGCIPPSPFPSLSWGVCFVQRVVSLCRQLSRSEQPLSNRPVSASKVNQVHISFSLLLLLLYFVILPRGPATRKQPFNGGPVFVGASPQQQHPA